MCGCCVPCVHAQAPRCISRLNHITCGRASGAVDMRMCKRDPRAASSCACISTTPARASAPLHTPDTTDPIDMVCCRAALCGVDAGTPPQPGVPGGHTPAPTRAELLETYKYVCQLCHLATPRRWCDPTTCTRLARLARLGEFPLVNRHGGVLLFTVLITPDAAPVFCSLLRLLGRCGH